MSPCARGADTSVMATPGYARSAIGAGSVASKPGHAAIAAASSLAVSTSSVANVPAALSHGSIDTEPTVLKMTPHPDPFTVSSVWTRTPAEPAAFL